MCTLRRSVSCECCRQVAPYITWGSVNVKSVREMVYKRGFAKVDGHRVALRDNSLIERELGTATNGG